MSNDITVDMTDDRPCNLRCASASNHDTYCAKYPRCVAGIVHRAQEMLGDHHTIHTITREEKGRSFQGGYNQNRILENPEDGTTVEEVELHCRTLQFDALLPKRPKPTAKK